MNDQTATFAATPEAEAVAAGVDEAGHPTRTAPLAWVTLAALFAAYILSFVDRMIIGLLVEPIKRDLQITDTQVSLLQGLAFALFFAIAAIPIGRLVDRVHRRAQSRPGSRCGA